MITGPLDQVMADLTERNPKHGALLSMLARIEEDFAESGWDQPPRLMIIMKEMLDDSRMALIGAALEPLPPAVAETGGPGIAMFLTIGAANIDRMFHPDERAKVLAFCLVHEGWKLGVDTDDVDAEWEATQAAINHTVHEHPDRIECRIVVAADRGGVSYQVMHERDGAVMARVDRRAPEYDDGVIPAALRTIAGVL